MNSKRPIDKGVRYTKLKLSLTINKLGQTKVHLISDYDSQSYESSKKLSVTSIFKLKVNTIYNSK